MSSLRVLIKRRMRIMWIMWKNAFAQFSPEAAKQLFMSKVQVNIYVYAYIYIY